MRLTELTVQNYRSITSLTRFNVEDLTTLVGPNNEGKSNLLRALALGMTVIDNWSRLPDELARRGELSGINVNLALRASPSRYRSLRGEGEGFRWQRDYPVSKQDAPRLLPTTIRLNFSLNEAEVREYRTATGIANNGELPIELRIGRNSASFGVVKRGPGAANHREKGKQIAQFVVERLEFVFVHAVRTGEHAQALANELMRLTMGATLRSPEYVRKIEELNQLRRAAVASFESNLAGSLRSYLPSIDSITLELNDLEFSDSIRGMTVDDGVPTSIDNKGDGIKSLVTMALIQELARLRTRSETLILAVDEPEAHLHPASSHELQRLFQQISVDQQVIVATHNPIFVNRDKPSSNVLVVANEAKPASNILQVRDAIGVQLHDNMESAEIVVLVEGISDASTLPRLLREVDSRWQNILGENRVVFRATKGTGRVRAQVQREKATVCKIVVVLDDDGAGRTESSALVDLGTLHRNSVFILGDSERNNSEVEDLLEPSAYVTALSDEFGRSFSAAHFRNKSRKWSQNFAAAVRDLGVAGDDEALEVRAKTAVATAVRIATGAVLKPHAQSRINALSTTILGPSPGSALAR